MDVPYTSHSVLTALQNLSQQTNRVEREAVLKAGLKEILKWFTLAAKNIIENKIKLPKQTTTFMTKHREEIQRLADPSIDEEIKRKIILKPGGGGFLGGVIIKSLLRWDGSKTARKFGDDRHSRKRAPRKSSKSSKKKSSKKKSSKKRTSRQHSPSTSVPISSPNTSHVDVSMRANLSPISSPRIVEAPVVDWSGQNTSNHFGIAESHPRVDERFITMRKKRSSVSEHPRFPLSRKALLIKNLYDLKKTNRRFLDKKMQFQPIPSKTWSSWSASLREKYRQAKRDKAQLMHNLGRENIFFSSSPIQTERIKKRLIAKSYKH